MSVWVVGIPKNRCRTTVAEPIGANASGTALTGDQAGLFKAQPGHNANWLGLPIHLNLLISAKAVDPVNGTGIAPRVFVRDPTGCPGLSTDNYAGRVLKAKLG